MSPTQPPTDSTQDSLASGSHRQAIFKTLLLLLVVVLFCVGYFQFGEYLTLGYLSDQEAELLDFKRQRPILVFAVAFCIYVSVTGLSLPGALVLSLACAWLLGFWQALLLVSFASTGGATISFLLSRYLFRDAIQNRFGDRLAHFNRALEQEGAFYLFTLRIIPAVPFFVINAVMGLTPIRVGTYWWVSQLGMLPGTCVYVFAGSEIPTAAQLAEQGLTGILTLPIVIAFILLGIFPIFVKKIMARFRSDMQKSS